MVERRVEPDFRRAEGVGEPKCHEVADQKFYLEFLSPDGSDTLYHLFAFPEYAGPWAPPDGFTWMRQTLAVFKEKGALPYSGDEPWCTADWDGEGVPEYIHFVVRSIDTLVDGWLASMKVEPARITGSELMRKVQDQLFPQHKFFTARLALLDRLKTSTLRELIAELGQELPEGADADEEIRKLIDLLTPMKPGVWAIAFRELQDKVSNHQLLAKTFLDCLVRS